MSNQDNDQLEPDNAHAPITTTSKRWRVRWTTETGYTGQGEPTDYATAKAWTTSQNAKHPKIVHEVVADDE